MTNCSSSGQWLTWSNTALLPRTLRFKRSSIRIQIPSTPARRNKRWMTRKSHPAASRGLLPHSASTGEWTTKPKALQFLNERNRLISIVTVRNKYWLIKIAIRRQQPSHVGESCLFQNVAQFTPKHRTIGRGEMERVPL